MTRRFIENMLQLAALVFEIADALFCCTLDSNDQEAAAMRWLHTNAENRDWF